MVMGCEEENSRDSVVALDVVAVFLSVVFCVDEKRVGVAVVTVGVARVNVDRMKKKKVV